MVTKSSNWGVSINEVFSVQWVYRWTLQSVGNKKKVNLSKQYYNCWANQLQMIKQIEGWAYRVHTIYALVTLIYTNNALRFLTTGSLYVRRNINLMLISLFPATKVIIFAFSLQTQPIPDYKLFLLDILRLGHIAIHLI